MSGTADPVLTFWDGVGNLAEWATVLVAFLAFIAAAIAAWVTIRMNRAQQETLELQRRQVERAQASKVTFYVGITSDAGKTAAHIFNASDSPIYYPTVVTLETNGRRDIAAGTLHIFPTKDEPHRLVLAKEGSFFDLYFQDTSGLLWIRSLSGELKRPDEHDIGTVEELLIPQLKANMDLIDKLEGQVRGLVDRLGPQETDSYPPR